MLTLTRISCAGLGIFAVLMISGCANKGGTKGGSMAGGRTWELGIQTGTFHPRTLYEAIDKTKALGLRYVEPHPWQMLSPDRPNHGFDYTSSAEVLGAAKTKLRESGVGMASCFFPANKNEAELRKIFVFAQAMGVKTLVGEPAANTLPLLDKLAAEYGVDVAIHNFPRNPRDPSYVYWNPDGLLNAIQGCSRRIGVCPDTGHWARCGVNPTEALKKLQGRIMTVHLKDVDGHTLDARDVPFGTGVADIRGVLAELYHQGFSGIFTIKYESNRPDNDAEVAQCITYFHDVTRSLGG